MLKIAIAIIEPSPVLGLGFKTLFEHYNSEFRIVNIYDDLDSFSKQIPINLDIILLNTTVIGYSKFVNIRKLFVDYKKTLLVALTVGHTLPKTLDSFDGMLHIYDDLEHIVKQLKTIFVSSLSDNGDILITTREKEIIGAIAQGYNNKHIAKDLNLAVNTIKTYRQRISSKLGIKGIAEFTSYAISNKLIA